MLSDNTIELQNEKIIAKTNANVAKKKKTLKTKNF
jgi:hypothetical protein